MPDGDDNVFRQTVKNLLQMKPKPHKEDASAPQAGQSDSGEERASQDRKMRSNSSRDPS